MKMVRNARYTVVSTAILSILGIVFTSAISISVIGEKVSAQEVRLQDYVATHRLSHHNLDAAIIEKYQVLQVQIDKKVDAASFDEFKDAVLRQLDRIEKKVDKNNGR